MKLEDRDRMIRKQALQEGLQVGRHEIQSTVIQNMQKKGNSTDVIAQTVGMTVDELRAFCKKNHIKLN